MPKEDEKIYKKYIDFNLCYSSLIRYKQQTYISKIMGKGEIFFIINKNEIHHAVKKDPLSHIIHINYTMCLKIIDFSDDIIAIILLYAR